MTTLAKVRCFVVDRTKGTPVPGIAVGLGTMTDAGDLVLLSILSSDRVGYLSFDVTRFAALLADSRLWLWPLLDTANRLSASPRAGGVSPGSVPPRDNDNVPPGLSDGGDSPCVPVVLSVDGRTGADACDVATWPSIQNPDSCDYQQSPGSFVTRPRKMLGDDCCETLLPSTLPSQSLTFRRVITRGIDVSTLSTGTAPAGSGHTTTVAPPPPHISPIDVTALPIAPPVSGFAYGEILDYRQEWYSLGHSLGDIRYSLALAPGEAVEIAVVDWSRQDQVSRTDDITSREYLANQLVRDRSIGETVDSMLNESQDGWSLMGGTAGAASYSYGTFSIAADHSVGGSIAHTSGTRNIEADSLQSLHDQTGQATAVVRTLNSTVVMQSTQAEQNVVQTRRVANHNHCHALTIEYYEVLKHFRLRTTFTGRRAAILLPFVPFQFDWSLALRFQSALVPALLDASLASAFDAISRYHLGSALYAAATASTVHAATPGSTATTQYFTGQKSVAVAAASANDPSLYLQKGSRVRMTASGKVGIGELVDTSGGYDADGNGQSADNGWYAPGKFEYSLICRVGSTWYQGGTSTEFVASDDGYLTLQANDHVGNLSDNSGSWAVDVNVIAPQSSPGDSVPAVPDPTAPPAAFTKDGDAYAESLLLRHLNGNRGYYNRVVWLALDDSDRRLYLDAALAGVPGMSAQVDSYPLAVSGNSVAFGFDGQTPLWSDTRPTDPTAPIETIVTLPTRGVFAEAMLGHCNACEPRDITRMWDWSIMTTEEPPAISDVTPGPRGTPDTVAPGSLPQNVVQISQPPAAPDPTGLAAALRVLGTPNVFRDMSGLSEVSSLLGTLANGAVTSLSGAQKIAQQAQQKVQAIQSGSAGGAGTSTGTRPTAAQTYDNLTAAKEIAKNAGTLGWDPQTTAEVTKAVVMGDGNPDIVQTGGAGASVGVAAALDLTIKTGEAVGKLLVPSGAITVSGFESGQSLLAGASDPGMYVDDDTSTIEFTFIDLGASRWSLGNTPPAGLNGTVRVSWVNCVPNIQKLPSTMVPTSRDDYMSFVRIVGNMEFKRQIGTLEYSGFVLSPTDALDSAAVTFELMSEAWPIGSEVPTPKESHATVRLTIQYARKTLLGGEIVGPTAKTFPLISPKNGGPSRYYISNQSGTSDVTSIVVTPMDPGGTVTTL